MSVLTKIQGKLVVQKTRPNTYGGYNYRSTEDIMLALKPFLLEENVILTITDNIESLGNYIYVTATINFKCGDESYSCSSSARDAIEQKGMSASQATNSASSFARKQALQGMFLLDDTDSQFFTEEETKEIQEKNKKELTPENVKPWANAIVAYKRDGNFNAIEERVIVSEANKKLIKEQSNVS